MLLEGRSAVITGASRGIGAAIARRFAAEGARVLLCGRGEGVTEVAGAITQARGSAVALRGDVREDAFLRQLVQTSRKEFGGLDVLVNNAGLMHGGVVGMTSAETTRELLEVNVVAPIALTQYAIRAMDPARGPSIVNVASLAGVRGLDGLSAYSASKGALVAYTRAAAKELAPRGIRVNAVAPGFIATGMIEGLEPELLRRRVESITMGRIGTPEEVASAVLFLASDLSRYVTGQVLGVDGGALA